MKYIYYCLIFIVVSLFVLACSADKQQFEKVNSVSINNQYFFDAGNISDLIEPSNMIVLETNKKCLINEIKKVIIYKSNIYVFDFYSQKIFLFDINGNYKRQVGCSGEGPGEYLEISDFIVDTISELIYLPDVYKVHIYSLNGDYIKSKKTNFFGTHISRLNKDRFIFNGVGKNDRLIVTDIDFNVVNTYFPYSLLYRGDAQYVFTGFKNKVLFHLSNCDTLYSIVNDKLEACQYFDFNGKNFTRKDFNYLSTKDKNSVGNYILESGKYIGCFGFLPLNSTAFMVLRYASESYVGYYNFDTKKYFFINQHSLVNDFTDSFMYFHPKGVTKDEFIFSLPASQINNGILFKKYDLGVLNRYSNPVLLLAKPKV